MGNVRTATQNDLTRRFLDPDDIARLNQLLAANAEVAKQRALFRSDREKFEAAAMKRPLTAEKAFAYLGLTLGSLGPFSIILSFLLEMNRFEPGQALFILLALLATTTTAAVGYATGKTVGRMIVSLRSRSWPTFIALSVLLGIAWGGISGGLGGIFLFVIGGFFGAIIGAMAAGIVLPVFAIAHRLLASGDLIEMKHFLPVAFGSVLTLCAFILGLS